jgi:hypothetical protein
MLVMSSESWRGIRIFKIWWKVCDCRRPRSQFMAGERVPMSMASFSATLVGLHAWWWLSYNWPNFTTCPLLMFGHNRLQQFFSARLTVFNKSCLEMSASFTCEGVATFLTANLEFPPKLRWHHQHQRSSDSLIKSCSLQMKNSEVNFQFLLVTE